MKDIVVGVSSSNVEGLVTYKGQVYFVADDTKAGKELWSSDGSSSGTTLLVDIHPGPISAWPQQLTVYKEWLYFSADHGGVGCGADLQQLCGRELWKTDGVASRTHRFIDVATGAPSGDPKDLIIYNNLLYFSAFDVLHGRELWVTDGETPAGNGFPNAHIVVDIYPGVGNANPSEIIVFNRQLYFAATDGLHGTELWKSDGTAIGTSLVKDINPGAASSYPASLALYGCLLYFAALKPAYGVELWRSNGYSEGTALLKDIFESSYSSNPSGLFLFNNILFFSATDNIYGNELWRTDGTIDGTFLFKDLNTGSPDSDPAYFHFFSSRLFFVAKSESTGLELYTSDGTIDGTFLLSEIFPGPEQGLTTPIASARGKLFFGGKDINHGIELYSTQICGIGEFGSLDGPGCSPCPFGEYSDSMEALECSKWTDCAPGTHISFTGNSTNDRLCTSCRDGMSSTTVNAKCCHAWTICSSSEYEVQKPSKQSDRLCMPCPSGTFTLQNNGRKCLSIFDHMCNSSFQSINWKMRKFCDDIFNTTSYSNSSPVFSQQPSDTIIFDQAFVVFISFVALFGSAMSFLFMACILTHHNLCQQSTLFHRQKHSSSRRLPSQAVAQNESWDHVINTFLSRPQQESVGAPQFKRKVTPSKRPPHT